MQQAGTVKNCDTGVIKKTCCDYPLGKGVSGGLYLWYHEVSGGIQAIGVQHVVSDPNDYTSWSPHITKDIVPQYYKDLHEFREFFAA